MGHTVTKVNSTLQQREPVAVHIAGNCCVNYPVLHPPHGVFEATDDTLAQLAAGRDALLVVDAAVDERFGSAIRQYAAARLRPLGTMVVPGGERVKSLAELERLCATAFALRLSRDGVIIGIGGGCTLDVAGFAAAIYRRGVAYVRVPTTLVGMVDVSVGVKHAVNFLGGKNVLGAFYPPIGAVVDLSLLRTLPRDQISCGLSEIIKMAVISDAQLFATLEQHVGPLLASRFQEPAAVASEVAVRAERLMAAELSDNLWEACRRRLVDFGHNVSPALEAASGFGLPHGQAVAIDMALSTAIGVVQGLCGLDVLERLLSLCARAGLATWQSELGPSALMQALDETRRHRGGALNLVVPVAIGSATFVQEVSEEDLMAATLLVSDTAPAERPVDAGTCL